MRTFVALCFAGLVLMTAGASQAGGGPTLSLSASAFRVLYNHPVTLTGRLSNHKADTFLVTQNSSPTLNATVHWGNSSTKATI